MTLPAAGIEVTTFAAEIWAALDGDTAALLRRLEERAAPHFGGSALAWKDSACANSTWTVRDEDEDAYTGPCNRRTAAPVLVVGSFRDLSTNYAGAVSMSRLLPNSRLLSSDNWGHGAYGLGTRDRRDRRLPADR